MISFYSTYVGYTNFLCLGYLVTYAYGQSTGNIALHKPAFQQNLFPSKLNASRFYASNAVDGLNSDLSALGGQCTISANNKGTATWWVNLTRLANINHIILYHRTENEAWDSSNAYTSRFLGFSVYVSNTTSISDGRLCFKDDYFNKSTIPDVFNTTCHIYGHYVIFYNERLPGVVYPKDYSTFAFADICEVEVYECDIGHFGDNCADVCGHCNDRTLCSSVNGTCTSGCSSGYSGHLCNKEDKKDWKSEFHGFVGAFCLSLVLNVVLIALIIVKWFKQSRQRLSTDQVQKTRRSEHTNDTFYEDLCETNKAQLYETCEVKKYVQG